MLFNSIIEVVGIPCIISSICAFDNIRIKFPFAPKFISHYKTNSKPSILRIFKKLFQGRALGRITAYAFILINFEYLKTFAFSKRFKPVPAYKFCQKQNLQGIFSLHLKRIAFFGLVLCTYSYI